MDAALGDDFEFIRVVGAGSVATVFLARERDLSRLVAVKVMHPEVATEETTRRRFEREIALAAQLRHPNIVPIYDSGVAEGRMYFAMEHVFGMGLGDYLKANQLDIPARLRLFVKICKAIAHAHQRGVIHRDLKPSNILVDGDGEPHILDHTKGADVREPLYTPT